MERWTDEHGGRTAVEQDVLRARTEPAALVTSAVETVTGVLEDAGERGSAAWAALRGPAPDALVRRWPWAVGAAVAGAAAGAAVALALGRVRTSDEPDPFDPDEVRAVVDRADGPERRP